jgi:hypothetical protein
MVETCDAGTWLNSEIFDFTAYMRYEVFMARTYSGYDM